MKLKISDLINMYNHLLSTQIELEQKEIKEPNLVYNIARNIIRLEKTLAESKAIEKQIRIQLITEGVQESEINKKIVESETWIEHLKEEVEHDFWQTNWDKFQNSSQIADFIHILNFYNGYTIIE